MFELSYFNNLFRYSLMKFNQFWKWLGLKAMVKYIILKLVNWSKLKTPKINMEAENQLLLVFTTG